MIEPRPGAIDMEPSGPVATEGSLASVVVLMVDDDREDVYLTRRAFRDRPRLKAFNFAIGGDALFDYLQRAEAGDAACPRPDLLLLDINMPGVNGFDVLARLRADPHWCALPVIVLSTSSSSRDVRRAHAAGANAFVAKPVTAAGMKAVAARIDEFWFDTVRLPSGT